MPARIRSLIPIRIVNFDSDIPTEFYAGISCNSGRKAAEVAFLLIPGFIGLVAVIDHREKQKPALKLCRFFTDILNT